MQRRGSQGHGTGILHYLNRIISGEKNAPSLPYGSDVKWMVRDHLLALVQKYPSLAVKDKDYVHNDGTIVHLLLVDGTVPIYYMEAKYNIPVEFWLVEGYPSCPPTCFVTPVPGMVIKPHHPHVNGSGQVITPYLTQWHFPHSNLVELIESMSGIFGADPPLFSKPDTISPPQIQHSPRPPPVAAPIPSPSTAVHSTSELSAYPPFCHPYPNQMVAPTVQQAWSQSSQAEDSSSQSLHQASDCVEARVPTDVFRHRAIEAIKRRLQAVKRDIRRRENNELLETQIVLLGRSGELEASLQQVNQERELLERRVAELSAANSSLDRWLLENEGKGVVQTGESELTDIFEADDVLARQALDCAAEDAAIEDTLYGLDRALQRNKISIEAYFKQVRLLTREQFFKRALGNLVSDRRTAQLREQDARASSERAAARAASSQFSAVPYGGAPLTGDALANEYTWT